MLVTAQSHIRKDLIHCRDQLMPITREIALIAVGCIVFAYGMNAVMIPARLFSGGLMGIALIIGYRVPSVDLGLVYLLLNVPLIVLGWMTISRRFIAYTFFGTTFFALVASILRPVPVILADPLLAALLGGVICGFGCGLILKSIGSAGGMDILAIYLNRRFGLRVGTIAFAANALVIVAGGWMLDLNLALYSIILLFTCGWVTNAVVSGFNARMALIIVSDMSDIIARELLGNFKRGVTFLDGEGGFSKRPKRVILTVTTVTEVPKIKEMIFSNDPKAFVVINNTFEVLGNRYGGLKVY
jgi:uncharacterized membrane-anchored protein YitT (DUF2179 family)